MSDGASAVGRYALAVLVLVALFAWVLTLFFPGAAARHAVLVAAALATVVQVLAFVLARRMSTPTTRIVGWGAGAGVSLLTLITFGFVARASGLPLEPALLGLATFLFVTELIEPFFLK